MRFYELEALCALGEQDAVMKEMKALLGRYAERRGYFFFGRSIIRKKAEHNILQCTGALMERVLCHAWGASPIYLLGKYYLGVKPVKEGYKEFSIAPALGGLKWMEGTVPTPNGDIQVYMDSKTIKVKSNGRQGISDNPESPPTENNYWQDGKGIGKYLASLD